MNIPDEAVEAAAKYLADVAGTSANNWEWHVEGARELLSTAAPYIKADAWDEGRKHGTRYPYGERGLATDDNPYRSQP